MNQRRSFLRMASAAVPAGAAILATGVAHADEGNSKEILGSWNTIHTLPFPPPIDKFREFLSFAEGGVLHETNSFLHTSSNLDFSQFGLPSVLNASDGAGNWTRVSNGVFQVVFRKLLFDGLHQNFGDLHVAGFVRVIQSQLVANWRITVIDLAGHLLADLGPATSTGTQIA